MCASALVHCIIVVVVVVVVAVAVAVAVAGTRGGRLVSGNITTSAVAEGAF